MASHADWDSDKLLAAGGHFAPAEPPESTSKEAGAAGAGRCARARPCRPGRRRLWYLVAMVTVLDAAIVGPFLRARQLDAP